MADHADDEILQLAAQGNLQALSVYLNRHLIPNGAHVKVKHKEDALQVLVVVMRPSGNQDLLDSTQRLLIHLHPANIQSVKIYTQVLGSKQISLQKQFSVPHTAQHSEPISVRYNPSSQGRSTIPPRLAPPQVPPSAPPPPSHLIRNKAESSKQFRRESNQQNESSNQQPLKQHLKSNQRLNPNQRSEPIHPRKSKPRRYSVAEFLSQATNIDELSVLHKHPFFTGACPNCTHLFADMNPPPVYWDCPKCGWVDDLSSAMPQAQLHQNSPQTSLTESKRLGDYLIEAGLLNASQIEVALADQLTTGLRFGEVLIRREWIKEETIEYLMQKIILPERSGLQQNDASYLESSRNLLKTLFQDRQAENSIHLPVAESQIPAVQTATPHEVLTNISPQESVKLPELQKPKAFGKLPNERETLILPDVELDELNEYLNGSGGH